MSESLRSGPANRGRAGWIRSWFLPTVQLTLSLFIYLSLLLGCWVLLGWGIGGWSPVVVTSGSMEPALSVGDVILIDTGSDSTAVQRSVIVFERPDGEVVAHRVFSVEPNGFVTKGDANEAPDTDRVLPDQVLGVGRLVVPAIGLPAVWSDRGNYVALGAWMVVSLAALVQLLALGLSPKEERLGRAPTEMPIAQQGVRRVRSLVAILIVAQYYLDASRFDVLEKPEHRIWLLLVSLASLSGLNLIGARVRGDSRLARAFPSIELGVDTALVVVFAALTGTSGIGWVFFALPIIEAAVQFRLIGALRHWTLLTAITLVARIWTAPFRPSSGLLDDLEMVLDQLSVLFLVVVPGAYLAEQLIGDVAKQQRATADAVDRGALLEQVTEVGREVARLGGEHIAAIARGARQLGFDVVDVCISDEPTGRSSRVWRRIDTDEPFELPAPGQAASGVRDVDRVHRAVIVDGSDPDPGEIEALESKGLDSLVVETVSSRDNHQMVLRAGMRIGNPLTPARLEAFRLLAGQAAVAFNNDQLLDEITSMHETMEYQAHHDSLTRLPNRALLVKELRAALAADDACPVLLFLDLDGFKPVNDRLGHDAGDHLLRLVAARLEGVAVRDALVARMGGDEFTMLIRGRPSLERAQEIADQVWLRISEPFDVNGDVVRISTSIGLAFGEPGVDESELIRRADVAMYRAKRSHQRTCEVHRPEFDVEEDRRARLVTAIPRALQRDELHLVYQPIHRVGGDSGVAGVEALVRWRHPVEGDIPPAEIVEAARSAKIRDELNRWIYRAACRQAAEWTRHHPDRLFFLSVNASPEELSSRQLVANVADALRISGLPASRLFVEISEQLVAPDVPQVVANMSGLRELGVGLLLDDFGEGQTSLSYLHELPVSGIKLDRRLVVNTLRSETDRVVLRSIVDLCRQLQLVVIAEGIETLAQLEVIADIGCQLVQGYYLDRPLTADAVEARLAESEIKAIAAPSQSAPRPAATDPAAPRPAATHPAGGH